MKFMQTVENFIVKEKFSYTILLIISVWGINQLLSTNIYFYTILTLFGIGLCSVIKLLGKCRPKCKCGPCRLWNVTSIFINFFSMTLLVSDILRMSAQGHLVYIPMLYSAIMLTYAHRKKYSRSKKQTFDFLNVSSCMLLCIVSLVEHNMYGIAAGLVNALINYISSKTKNKRKQCELPIRERKNYLQMIFIYLSVCTIMTMVGRRVRFREAWRELLHKIQICTCKMVAPFNSVSHICTNSYRNVRTIVNEKVNEVLSSDDEDYECDCEVCRNGRYEREDY